MKGHYDFEGIRAPDIREAETAGTVQPRDEEVWVALTIVYKYLMGGREEGVGLTSVVPTGRRSSSGNTAKYNKFHLKVRKNLL